MMLLALMCCELATHCRYHRTAVRRPASDNPGGIEPFGLGADAANAGTLQNVT